MIFARSLVVLVAGLSCLADTSRAIELLVFGPEGLIMDGQPPTTKTPGRSKKQATSADNSPQTIEDKLNELRRDVPSSNMNYAVSCWRCTLCHHSLALIKQLKHVIVDC